MESGVSSIHGFYQTHAHYVKVVVEYLVLHIWEVKVRASDSESFLRIFVPFPRSVKLLFELFKIHHPHKHSTMRSYINLTYAAGKILYIKSIKE
jgi:hypothetical protein